MKQIVWGGLTLCFVAFLALCAAVNLYGGIDQARAADVIVTLGARVSADGSPGADLASRTHHSVALFNVGLAPYMVCTGGVAGDPSSAAAVSRKLATQLGVPGDKVLLAEDSMSTQQDAERVASIMEQHQWRSAIVVSHPLHLLRAKILFIKEGVKAYTSPTPLASGELSLEARIYYTTREALGVLAALLPKGWLEAGVDYWSGHARAEAS